MGEIINPTTVEQGYNLFQTALLLAPLIGAIGFTKTQRDAIVERDGGKCQHPDKSIQHGGSLEVDHIIPKRFAEKVLGWGPEEYNVPENGLTECQNHHVGHPHSRHPDAHKAKWDYRGGDKLAIQKMINEREEKVARGETYWNEEKDVQLMDIAYQRTKNAKKKGWTFPIFRRKK